MKAGVYDDLSNIAYHAETDWVSSTQLKRLLPDEYGPPPKDQSALWFGSALHTRILGGPSEPWSIHDYPTWQSKAAKIDADWAIQHGEVPVLKRDVDTIEAMADAVKSHPEASNLLYGLEGQSEVSVFAEVNGVPMKARFDRVTGDGVLVDLKSTSEKPNKYDLAKAVIRYGYELSAIHYLDVAASVPEFADVDVFKIVWVGKEPPHYVTVSDLDSKFMERGNALRSLALSRYLHPQFEPAYPGEREPVTLQLPRWAEL